MTRQLRLRWRRVRRVAAVVSTGSLLAAGLALIAPTTAAAAVPRCLASPRVLPVSIGGQTSFSLDRNGSLWGWGDNYWGQIGNGNTAVGQETDFFAERPMNASGFSNLQAVSAGGFHVMALRQDGTVWGWGSGQTGQLGDGQTGDTHARPIPTPVPGLSNVVALETGPYNTFALKGDGTVWAWGRNDEGQLGDGTTTHRSVPTQIPNLNGFVGVSAADRFTLGVKSDGSVWAWGYNGSLQLGANVAQYATQLTPVQVPGIANATAVAAGGNHSVALRSDGTVWSWGNGYEGQLGNGSTSMETATPQQASNVVGITQIAAGGAFTLALRTTGFVRAWGSNVYGELGNGPNTPLVQPTWDQVSTLTGVAAIDAGSNGALALTSSGQVWAWGINARGEVGNGNANYPNAELNPVRSPYRTFVTQAAPAAPKDLAAVAGKGLAYLEWTAPTSAVTQYVITPTLNGVVQPEIVAPPTETKFTVSNLVEGGSYSFTVVAQNCLGTGPVTPRTDYVVPTGVQLNEKGAKVESSRITDRQSMHVNTFNGNLAVTARDLTIKGTGLDLDLTRTYNNLADETSNFGNNWSANLGNDVSLTVLTESVMFNGPGGYEVGFAKNADGTYTTPSGIDATLVKNGDGTYTLAEHGNGERWFFSSTGVATARADRNGNTIAYAYGGPNGALSSITDTQGRVTTVAYNPAGLVATITDPANRTYQYGYDAANNLTSYTDPASQVTVYDYDASKNLTKITTPAGRAVEFTFDGSKRATSIKRPLQAGQPTTTFTYSHLQTVVTDANSKPTTYVFDTVGRTKKVIDALGNETAASYTSGSNVAAYSSGSGGAGATFAYDSQGNLTRADIAPGARTTLGYTDPAHPHRPTTITDAQNNTTSVAYDAAGNVQSTTNALPVQKQASVTRNAKGLVATGTDARGNVTSYGYDTAGNLTTVTPPAPLGVTTITYDVLSRPETVTDGKAQTTTYGYDPLDRVTSLTYHDGSAVTRVYDADGNLTSETDSNGTTTMTYDAMGRLTQRTAGGVTVAYAHDGVGNLLTLTDPGGTTTYGYNAVNLPTSVTAPGGIVITMGYDANYNRTSVAYPNGYTITSTYDSANRLVTHNNQTYSYKPSSPTAGSARAVSMRGSPSVYSTNGTTSGAVTLATPTGVQPGDVLLAQISTTYSSPSAPSGWTLIRADATETNTADLRQHLYYRVATAAEPASFQWTVGSQSEANGALTAWTGVDTAAPIKASSGRVDATGHDTYANTIAVDEPLGWWRLGEASGTTAADSSGNGRSGTYTGTVTKAQAGALVDDSNTAALFAVNGYVGLGAPTAFKTQQFSIEAWFKTVAAVGKQQIYRWRTNGNELGLQDGRPYVAYYGPDGLRRQVQAFSGGYADGEWHHLVGTFDGKVLELYVDGWRGSGFNWDTPVTYGTGAAAIGRDGNSSTSHFNGTIDEVAVYGRALSSVRVDDHYAAGLTAHTNPPWVAPSTSYTNGEMSLAFYGGRLSGPAAALSVPSGYKSVYDTGTNGITTGLFSKNLGVSAGATGDQTVTGPPARWVGQQVLLRPEYDTSLRLTTPRGMMRYDQLNRLTNGVGVTYAYDGTGNRIRQTKLSDTITYEHNAANELTKSTSQIRLLGTGTGSTNANGAFAVSLPSGIAPGDQILLAIIATRSSSVSVPSYTAVAEETSRLGLNPSDAKIILFRRTADGTESQILPQYSDPTDVMIGVSAVYRGVDQTNPMGDVRTAGAEGTTKLTIEPLTYAAGGQRAVIFQGAAGNSLPGTWTPPTEWTQLVQHTATPLRSGGLAEKPMLGAGVTSHLTSTIATAGGIGASLVGVGLTLRPDVRSFAHDANGNMTQAATSASTESFTYDSADRTTNIAGPSSTAFTYRGAGQAERTSMSPATRVSGACPTIVGCTTPTTTLGSNSTFVHTALGITSETIDGAATYYVRDPRGGLLAERTPTANHYYRFDGQGTITGLLDSTGATVASYAYDAYGQLTSITGGTVATNNPWRYVGAYQDGTGLYKMGHRYYDPILGRWTQQDPIHDHFDPKQWNRYAYVGGDPVNFTDPNGLSVWDSLKCMAERTLNLGNFFDPGLGSTTIGAGGKTIGAGYYVIQLAQPQVIAGIQVAGFSRALVLVGGFIRYLGMGVVLLGAYFQYRDCF